MFVRSMTIHLVERGTLAEYRFLEHGAFWAIIVLGVIMLVSARFHIPETFTGLIGATLIGLSLWWSIRHNRAGEERARRYRSRAVRRCAIGADTINCIR